MTSLVFLPGHMCDARVWMPIAAVLGVLGYDLCHVSFDDFDNLDQMAHHAFAQVEGPIIPIGFSMGAIVALAMYRADPDRIAALCLVGVNASADLPERSAGRVAHRQMVREGRMLDVVRDAFLPAYFAQAHAGRTDLHELCVNMAVSVGPDAFLRQSEALRARPDARPGLRAITCPTLVLGSEEDRLCPPEWHRETAAAIAHATLEIMPGGHMALIERPDDMAQRISAWLSHIKEPEHV